MQYTALSLPAMKSLPEFAETLPEVKRVFPFRVGTTSYILPADILTNIRFLGPFLDEIELVLFESRHAENLPSRAEVREMRRLADQWELTYIVHLPTDIYLCDPDPVVRQRACATVMKFYERLQSIEPAGYVLHLQNGDAAAGKGFKSRQGWIGRAESSLLSLFGYGVDPTRVAVENLADPPEWIQPVILRLGMALCLDIGHLLIHGYELEPYLSRFFMINTPMIHLHGVQDGKDHRSIAAIDSAAWDNIRSALGAFTGSLTLEVFSLPDLKTSLEKLRGML